ncbi:MAG: DUF1854 domain-containing protein [Sulfuricellaceae bacterium]|nr:DUF1854 domain-containing protein [Sulfuricellaceae bacterium]
MNMDFTLSRNPFGKLDFTATDGSVHPNIVPVRAFPIAAPLQDIALVSEEGHELAWIADLAALADGNRTLLEAELASREFMPEMLELQQVSSFATPSTWEVKTDRGSTTFILKAEEDIRRLSQTTLLIADSNGIHYLIRDVQKLDRHSRKLLDRFL